RELLQFPDGRIGSKWLNEIMPELGTPRTLAAKLAEPMTFPTDGSSFLLTFEVLSGEAGKGRLGISFLPEHGEQADCELQVGLDDRRAQFGPGSLTGFAEQQSSLREGSELHNGGYYAIENLTGVDRPFTMRILVKADNKIGGSLIDAEVAG